jgi:hypothetical protein
VADPNRPGRKDDRRFSPELLDLDAVSGGWLRDSLKHSPVRPERFPSWELELEEGVIWFGDETRRGLVASIHAIATFAANDGQFVWAWATEKLAPLAERAQQICVDRPEVPEFGLTLLETDDAGAWTLAAAVAHTMGADVCFRLPGPVALFVGLTDLTELAPNDPRTARPTVDPAAAAEALAQFAGQAAIQLGAALYQAAPSGSLDGAIAAIHTVADRLEALATSPVGRGTPAADEATALAADLRAGAFSVALPPGHPSLDDALLALFALLERTARRYGAVGGQADTGSS